MGISDQIKTIIWDWNGTLLNDLHICIETINLLLTRRELPLLNRESYREVFSFPVREYYKKIGFDFNKEPFEFPAKEFIDEYTARVDSCQLHTHARHVLQAFQEKGLQQFVLSAMQQEELERTIGQHRITHYFQALSGLDNHYAASKTENGKILLQSLQIDPNQICLIGDTSHDYEVARELGCHCILIADGHQSAKRLRATGSKTLKQLEELL